MIRNSIDYSEYEIQRSNFEFWDQLHFYYVESAEGHEYPVL